MRELFKEIGIETFGDLQRFKNECMQENETLQEALERHLKEIKNGI